MILCFTHAIFLSSEFSSRFDYIMILLVVCHLLDVIA